MKTPIEEIKRIISEKGSQSQAAKFLEISPAYLNDILHERRGVSPALLKKLGLVELRVYVRKSSARTAKEIMHHALKKGIADV